MLSCITLVAYSFSEATAAELQEILLEKEEGLAMESNLVQHITPSGLPDSSPYGFSQITVIPPEATLVYIAGQYGADENDNLVADNYADQLEQAFANLRTALGAVGARPEDVIKITILSVDHNMEKLHLISAARNAMWPGDFKPASTLIPTPTLAVEGMLFEIDAVVAIPNDWSPYN